MNIEAMLLKAAEHEELGQLDAARMLYTNAIKTFPFDTRANAALSRIDSLYSQNIRRLTPLENRIQELVLQYNGGNYRRVINEVDRLLSHFQASAVIYKLKAAACMKTADFNMAISALESSLKLKPNDTSVLNELGVACESQGDLARAARYFRSSLSADPNNLEAVNNLAVVLSGQHKFDEAISYFQAALRLNPNYAFALNNLGNAFLEIGKVAEAASSFQKAINSDRRFILAQDNLAKLPSNTLSTDQIDLLRIAYSTRAAGPIDAQDEQFRVNYLRHMGQIPESFNVLKSANERIFAETEEECKLALVNMHAALRSAKEWMPRNEAPDLSSRSKLVVLIGPSRSGKSTVEHELARSPLVLRGHESWKSEKLLESAIESGVNDSVSDLDHFRRSFLISDITDFSESDDYGEENEILTLTNPNIIKHAHLLADAFRNVVFVLVKRDRMNNAAEIFARDYGGKNLYSYSKESALAYVDVCSEISDVLIDKLPMRAIRLDYEEFLVDPLSGIIEIEKLIGVNLKIETSSNSIRLRNSESEYLTCFATHTD